MIMSSRQFVFLQINKIHNYTNILFITFWKYKMSLFKDALSGLRQFLAFDNPLRMILKNALKARFVLKIF